MNLYSILHKTLARALSIKRPYIDGDITTMSGEQLVGSAFFTDWLVQAIPEILQDMAWIDGIGNLHVDARTKASHTTLFVAHTDTVHHEVGANKIFKARTVWSANGAPLGADDGAGCALLMHMLHGGVAGYYVFTVGEECGGIGSRFLTTHYPDLLCEFDRAIAFDRRGVDSIITHQAYGRCCSDLFADALSGAFNTYSPRFMYSPDDTGVYTDTAEFVDYISECTNISVGYYNEHTDREYLDLNHFKRLSRAVLQIKWDDLPTERIAGEEEGPDIELDAFKHSWYTLDGVEYDMNEVRDY